MCAISNVTRHRFALGLARVGRSRYIPSGSAGSSVLSTSVVAPMSSSKGYFSGLRAANDVSSEKTLANVPSRAEMSATVKAAARAAAARLAGDKNPPSASASGIGGGAGLMEEGGGKRIERDIFAARPSRGQALGVSAGGYDVYPETGDFETYDSDEVSSVCHHGSGAFSVDAGLSEEIPREASPKAQKDRVYIYSLYSLFLSRDAIFYFPPSQFRHF